MILMQDHRFLTYFCNKDASFHFEMTVKLHRYLVHYSLKISWRFYCPKAKEIIFTD